MRLRGKVMKYKFKTKKNKVFAVLLAVIMLTGFLPTTLFAAGGTVDLASLDDAAVVINGENLSEWDGKTLTGTSRSGNQFLAVSGVEVHLTIKDLSVNRTNDGIYNYPAISLENGASLFLTLEGDSTLVGHSGGAGISVPEGCTLTVTEESTGSLSAVGGSAWGGAAGIGANAGNFNLDYPNLSYDSVRVGKIVIAGGTVNATGGSYKWQFRDYGGAAGIGGSAFGDSGAVIEITGGTVNATGGAMSAGIGGGYNGSIASVSVSGGTVTATKGTAKRRDGSVVEGNVAAAVGSGYFDTDPLLPCGDITVTDGVLTTNGNIGYGNSESTLRPASGGTVTVSGGSVDVGGKIDGIENRIDESFIIHHYALRLLVYADGLKAAAPVVGTVTVGEGETTYTDENVSFTLTNGKAEANFEFSSKMSGNQPITVYFGGTAYADKTVNLGSENEVLWGIRPELKVVSSLDCKYTYNNGFLTITGTGSVYEGRVTVTMADGVSSTSHQIRVTGNSKIAMTLRDVSMNGGERSTLVANEGAKLTLILDGENSMTSNCHYGKVVDVSSGELTIKGSGGLSIENTAEETNRGYNAGIWADTLTVESNPTLTVRIYKSGIGLHGSTVNILGGKINADITGADEYHTGYGDAGIGGTYEQESTVNISGGTVYAAGGDGLDAGGAVANKYTQAVITGGNVNMNRTYSDNISTHKQPTNADGTLLFCTVITLGSGDSLSANAKVTETRIKLGQDTYSYGLENTYTDGNGRLYLWLPEGAVVSRIRTSDGTYTGECTTNTQRTKDGNQWGTAKATFESQTVAEITDADGTVRKVPALKTSVLTDGCTVKLLQYCLLTETLRIPKDISCTVDLNGKNITYTTSQSDEQIIVLGGGKLTFTGTGAVWCDVTVGSGTNSPGTLEVLSDGVSFRSSLSFWAIGETRLTNGLFHDISVTLASSKDPDAAVADLLADGYIFKNNDGTRIINGNVKKPTSTVRICPSDGHEHTFDTETFRCSVCGVKCRHTNGFSDDGKCNDCGYVCTHESTGDDGKCSVCGKRIFDPTVISVDIVWEAMSFTYSEATATDGAWSWDGATETKTAPSITVTNKSRSAVRATFTFTGEAEIGGSFGSDTLTVAEATQTKTQTEQTTFNITNGKISKNQVLGVITVAIATAAPAENKDS